MTMRIAMGIPIDHEEVLRDSTMREKGWFPTVVVAMTPGWPSTIRGTTHQKQARPPGEAWPSGVRRAAERGDDLKGEPEIAVQLLVQPPGLRRSRRLGSEPRDRWPTGWLAAGRTATGRVGLS